MLSRLRVPLGYVAGVLAFVLAEPQKPLLVSGLALAVAGEVIRLWASGHIEKTVRLATGGPYAHTRNPLYFGSVLLGAGVAMAAGSVTVALATVAYFAAFYPWAIRSEAAFLAGKFGEEYSAWAREVPIFLPVLRPVGPRASHFSLERLRKNRELRTALAIPFVAGLLYLRLLYPKLW